MATKEIEITCKSKYAEVALVAQAIIAMVKLETDSDALLGCIELCVVEIANNVIEHAYKEKDNLAIFFKVNLSKTEVSLVISDEGDSMPDSTLAKRVDWNLVDKNDTTSWEVSGRGLQLVKDLMDDVSYWTESDNNHFKMVKKFS